MRVAGIMSGTSLDGIDVAIVEVKGRSVSTLAFHTRPYPEKTRKEILAVSNAATHTAAISRLNFRLGELYAAAVIDTCRRARVPLESVKLIGCHGQTVYHEGQPGRGVIANTLQIGEADVIAERTGIAVVSGFRTRDMAAGGTGAPLVPFVDYLLLRDARCGRVALNIGGIANITAIPAGAAPEDVIAFDTGPGNMAIDALTSEYTKGRLRFDRGGCIAARGHVNRPLLRALLRDRYFSAPPPKTAGREQYGTEFISRLKQSRLPLEDLVATATVFTAATVAAGIERFVRPRQAVDELIVSGGGVHNPVILAHLTALLQGTAIASSAAFGIDPDAKEAIAFAVLAHRTWVGKTGNLPGATGARRPVVLGKISPAAQA